MNIVERFAEGIQHWPLEGMLRAIRVIKRHGVLRSAITYCTKKKG